MMRIRNNRQRVLSSSVLSDAPCPGEAVIATVHDDDGCSLLSLRWEPEALGSREDRMAVPIGEDAREALRVAAQVGWTEAPWVRVRDLPRRVTVRRLVDDARPVMSLHGRSLGLAAAWAAACWVARCGPPAHVAALGTVDQEGRVAAIDGVASKARRLVASGVHTLYLPAANVSQVDVDVALHPVHHVQELVAATLRPAGRGPRWSPEEVDGLLGWVERGDPPVPSWAPLHRTLDLLKGRESVASEVAEALRIAARHLDDTAPAPWPAGLEGQPRPVRLRRLAHLLQSHTDHGAVDPEPWVSRALEFLADDPLERTASDFEVMGAAGRLLSATGQLERAWTLLWQAADGYRSIRAGASMGRSVCALLWLAALHPERAQWRDRAMELCRQYEGETRTDQDRAYIALAVGRLEVRAGGAPDALQQAMAWGPAHVRDSAARWWMRAGGTGRTPTEGTPFAALAQLDRCVDRGDDPRAALNALQALQPRRTRQVMAWARGDVARHVADAWPY